MAAGVGGGRTVSPPLGNAQTHPRIAAWRDAMAATGVSGRKFPSSVESLLRRAFKGGEPPCINPLVDFYNSVSLRHVVPAGGFDLAQLGDVLELRLAHEGDTFRPLDSTSAESVEPGEVASATGNEVAQLSAEFRDPERDVLRSTLLSVGLITLLYVAVAAATVGTGTYGAPDVNRVAVARLLGKGLGVGAGTVAASLAVLISLATANAYVAATARLRYALARDCAFPSWLDHLDERGVPTHAVLAVGGYAAIGMLLSYMVGWDPEDILVVPTSLGLATYIVGSAAGTRLLAGGPKLLAMISMLLCLVVFPFAGAFVGLPAAVAAAAWSYRRLREQNR